MFSVIENSMNLDALYLVKLIFDFWRIFLLFRLKSRRRFIATVLGRKPHFGAREC